MAGISFYDAYIPTMASLLTAFQAVLTKAEAHAREKGLDFNAEYAPAKLYEDMLPLTYQVQVTTNLVKTYVEKVAGKEVASAWEDSEALKTFEQLIARLKKAQELLQGIKPQDIDGKEGQEIEAKMGPLGYKTTSLPYVTSFILPNIFFHLQTAYSILRMKGVPLGKRDYLGPFLKADPKFPGFPS